MSVRPCHSSDLPLDGAPWLVPDAELGDTGHSLVEEQKGQVVAAGLRRRSRVHDDNDPAELWCTGGHGAEVLRALARADTDRPVTLRVLPGTPTAAAVAEHGGAEIIQSLPPARIATGHPEVQEWVVERLERAEREGVELRPGTAYRLEELLDLWVEAYLRQHAHWAPVADVDALREGFRTWFSTQLDTAATFVALIQGHPVAATYLLGELEGVLVPIVLDLQPGHPEGETCAAASVASMLTAVGPRPVEFDGHADEPLYMQVLESMPQRSAGVITPMDMVRIGAP